MNFKISYVPKVYLTLMLFLMPVLRIQIKKPRGSEPV